MVILDRRALANYGKQRRRDVGAATLQVIHRTADMTIEALADLFKDPALGTGGAFPYHFLVMPDGQIVQMARIGVATPGAGSLNAHAIHIALPGDFRHKPPPVEQYQALLDLMALLVALAPNVSRHSPSKAGASKDPNKECPGEALDVNLALERAKVRAQSLSVHTIGTFGIVI